MVTLAGRAAVKAGCGDRGVEGLTHRTCVSPYGHHTLVVLF